MAAALIGGATACNEDDLTKESSFDNMTPYRTAFDEWLLDNYVTPYNIDFIPVLKRETNASAPGGNPPGAGSIGGGASQLVGWRSSQAVFPFSGSASCGAEPQQRQPAEQRKPSPGPTGQCCSRRQS